MYYDLKTRLLDLRGSRLLSQYSDPVLAQILIQPANRFDPPRLQILGDLGSRLLETKQFLAAEIRHAW